MFLVSMINVTGMFQTKQLENEPKGVGRGVCQVDFEAQNDGVRQDGQGYRLRCDTKSIKVESGTRSKAGFSTKLPARASLFKRNQSEDSEDFHTFQYISSHFHRFPTSFQGRLVVHHALLWHEATTCVGHQPGLSKNGLEVTLFNSPAVFPSPESKTSRI